MLHTETQMSILPQYQEDCTVLCTVVQSARTALMQPRSNHGQERQKYYALLQLEQGGHPPPCSTMHYGQVQKKQWTQLTDVREVVGSR